MAEMTPKQFFEEEVPRRLAAKPDLTKEIGAVVLFEVTGATGGQWTLDATRASDWVSPGTGATPRMTVTLSDADLMAVVARQLNPQMAAMSGKLKFKPMDLNLAMKLGKLLA